MIDRDQIRSKMSQNTQVLEVLSSEDLIDIWEKTKGKKFAQALGSGLREFANYASAILDIGTVEKLINDMGITGRVVLKSVKGKQYVIFKGLAGTRSIFTGTRYLATNTKVVDMAIGRVGVNRSVVSGARITIFLIVPLDILNYVLSDQQTMLQLVGATATDLMKVGAAAAIASTAANAVVGVTTLAAGPLVVAIAVGLAAGFVLDAIDRQFGLTDALAKAMDDYCDQTFGEIGRQWKQLGEDIQKDAMTGGGWLE
jgi:hypothetical protein